MALLADIQSESGATSLYQRITKISFDRTTDPIHWHVTVELYLSAEARQKGLRPLETRVVHLADYAVQPSLLGTFYTLLGAVVGAEGDAVPVEAFQYELPFHDPAPPGPEGE